MARPRPLALLLAAPLLLVGCGRGDPAANNAAEADNRAVADLLGVPDNSVAASTGGEAAPPKKDKPSAPEPEPRERHARAGERG